MNPTKSAMTAVAIALPLVVGACGTMGLGHHSQSMPTEPGQGAFGAIAEIVGMLERDPNTDWSTVDVSALRDHLVDMNALVLNANVSTTYDNLTVRHRISGSGTTLRAIQAMVPAHSQQMQRDRGWDIQVEPMDQGTQLTLTAKDQQQLQRFKALGFFGFMATGAHHQPHHLGMATGRGHAHHH